MDDKALNLAIKTCFDYFVELNASNNSLQKWFRFIDLLDSQLPQGDCFSKPHSIFFEVTSKCNLRCKHCFYTGDEKLFNAENDLSSNEIISLSEFLIDEIGIVDFVLIGKEPLLKENIVDIIKFLKNKNVYLKLQTNAILVNDDMVNFLKDTLNPNTDVVQVSLDGVNEKTHDEIRGKGTFKKTISSIEKMTQNGINVIISYTVNSLNVKDLPDFYELGKNLNIRQVLFGRFESNRLEHEYLTPETKEVILYLSKLLEKNKSNYAFQIQPSLLKIFSFLDFKEGKILLDNYIDNNDISQSLRLKCHRDDRIMIAANGDVYLCPSTRTDSKEFSLGNVREKSFDEIWENRFNNVFFANRCVEKSVCKNCKYLTMCNCGCTTNAYFKYGNISSPDSFCNYANVLKNNAQIGV